MSKENTIVAKRRSDGTIVQVLSDGSTKPFEDQMDWDRFRAMTDEEVTAAAMSDPDAAHDGRATPHRAPSAAHDPEGVKRVLAGKH